MFILEQNLLLKEHFRVGKTKYFLRKLLLHLNKQDPYYNNVINEFILQKNRTQSTDFLAHQSQSLK